MVPAVFIALATISMLSSVFGVVPYILLRSREPIKSREWDITLVQLLFILVDQILTLANFPSCPVNVLQSCLVIPMIWYPFFLRAAILWYKFYLQTSMLPRSSQSQLTLFYLRFVPHLGWVAKKSFLWGAYLFIFLSSLLGALLILFLSPLAPAPDEVCWSDSLSDFTMLQGVVGVVLLLTFSLLHWNVHDGFAFKHELGAIALCSIPILIAYVLSDILNWTGVTGPDLYVFLFEIVTIWAMILLPLFTVLWNMKRMRQLKSNRSQELDQILQNPTLRESLTKFARETWTLEHLLFYVVVNDFHSQPNEEMKERTHDIYETYIRVGSPREINIDFSLREAIMESITKGEFTKEIFDNCQKAVLDLLRQSVLPAWRLSHHYKESAVFPAILEKKDSLRLELSRISEH